MHRSAFVILLVLLSAACSEMTRGADPAAVRAFETSVEHFALPMGNGVTLHVAAAPFKASEHTVHRHPGQGRYGVFAIDGRPYFGSDYDVPRSVLVSMELEANGRRVPLDVSGMFNPWYDAPASDQFRVDTLGRDEGYRVVGRFSDAAGAYVAELIVGPGRSLRTVLAISDRMREQLFPDEVP